MLFRSSKFSTDRGKEFNEGWVSMPAECLLSKKDGLPILFDFMSCSRGDPRSERSPRISEHLLLKYGGPFRSSLPFCLFTKGTIKYSEPECIGDISGINEA